MIVGRGTVVVALVGIGVSLGFLVQGCAGRVGADGPRAYAGDIASRDIARGEEVFTLICGGCHAGRVNPDGYGWEPWRMRLQVREGNHLMPPVRTNFVSEADLEAVLAYLSTTGAVVGELPPSTLEALLDEPVDVAGDPAEGLAPPAYGFDE